MINIVFSNIYYYKGNTHLSHGHLLSHVKLHPRTRSSICLESLPHSFKVGKGSNVIDVKSRKLILILIVIIMIVMITILKMITSLNSAQLVSPSRSLSRARVELGLLRAHHLHFKMLWELQCLEDQQEGALAIFRADYLLFKI